ncbi:MAG TPA: T9SS type A sorting domain-containing protein [Candidatus Kapabacteria bacterium]|nr:T9SS type A sorting domain-containing protein [Candidatus Kapabacteria bacterium]
MSIFYDRPVLVLTAALLRFTGILISLMFFCHVTFAQWHATPSRFSVVGQVLDYDGTVFFALSPGTLGSPSLNFNNDKSYFTCHINGNTYFTNNQMISVPQTGYPNSYKLGSVDSIYNIGDTVRAVWANRNGVDIIQDAYPVEFPRQTCQIVLRWKFRNLSTSTPVSVACQWLNDIDISDPRDVRKPVPKTPDAPIILNSFTYDRIWQQFPGAFDTVTPWFYAGFFHDLPGPGNDPGLAAVGFCDYPAMGLTKPSAVTIGDWFTMWTELYGSSDWKSLFGLALSDDDAVLLQFKQIVILGGSTAIGAATSYGTYSFEYCSGNLFGVLDYPHQILWDRTKHIYTPNPFPVKLLVVNANSGLTVDPLQISLTVGDHLWIWDTLAKKRIGKTQTLTRSSTPSGKLGPGDVEEYDWWVNTDTVYFCKDNFIGQLKFSGTSSLGDPFSDRFNQFGDTCEHPVEIGCAETDTLPPLHDSFTSDQFGVNDSIVVHDDRKTPILDRGLDTVWWKPVGNTNPSYFTITLLDPIKPCYNDTYRHRIVMQQHDSTIGGCFHFYFLDCIGNLSDTILCMPPHPVPYYRDTLPPQFFIDYQSGTFDSTLVCNNRFDSILVTDSRLHDRGLDSIFLVPKTAPNNMTLTVTPFKKGSPIAWISLRVLDSMQDGLICVRARDTARPPNHTDTCFSYCPIKDTLKPIIEIVTRAHPWQWHVIVSDNRPWDRKIDSIWIPDSAFITLPVPPLALAHGDSIFEFDVESRDTVVPAHFCVAANDLAVPSNVNDSVCAFASIQPDTMAPNIIVSPTSTTSANVTINDIHYPNSYLYVWDTGVDSIWFTNVKNIATSWGTDTARSYPCLRLIDPLSFSVIDPNLVDTTAACITINAIDCAKNISSWTWCYPYVWDSLPPLIIARYLDKQRTQVTVTDNRLNDRGNEIISTFNDNNLTGYNITANRAPLVTFTLQRPNLDVSSSDSIFTTDRWGSVFLADSWQHSAWTRLRVCVQDLAMQKGAIIRAGTQTYVPIVFVHNDNIPVAEKRITAFRFSFTPNGDDTLCRFLGVNAKGTATETGWQIDTLTKGKERIVSGEMLSGVPLTSPPDTMINLVFEAINTTLNGKLTLDVNEVNGETIMYNNGIDTIYSGYNSIDTMPPPWGTLSGGDIIIAGICVPIINNDSIRSGKASLDIPIPNPVSHIATLHYTTGESSTVRLGIYDLLGREVKQLVFDSNMNGSYSINADISNLNNGQYIVRLETTDGVITRILVVQK